MKKRNKSIQFAFGKYDCSAVSLLILQFSDLPQCMRQSMNSHQKKQ